MVPRNFLVGITFISCSVTRVFDHFKVDLSNEQCESAVKIYNLNNMKHMKNNLEIENPVSPVVSVDAPDSKRQRTEENPPVFQNEFFQLVPPSPPLVNHNIDLNKNMNVNSFFPDFESPTRDATNILEGMHTQNKTTFIPLFSSNQNFSTSSFSSDFLTNLLKAILLLVPR